MIVFSPVFILLVILVAFLVRRGVFSDFKVSNILKWIMGVYAAALLISVAVLFMLPQAGFAPTASKDHLDIYFAAKSGQLEQTEGIYAKGKWSFNYSVGTLEIAGQPGIMLWAQRKDSDDAKVDAVLYVAKSTADGIDYTDKIILPSVDIVGNKLLVISPSTYLIKLSRFEREFNVSQFSGESLNRPGFSGQELILLLSIPKSLELVGAPNIIQFVDN